MSWFNFKKEKREVPKSKPEEQCPCVQSDSLSFEALFGRDYSYRSLGPVYASAELISNALASMPLRVVKEDEEGRIEVVKHHPLQRIFRNRNIQTMSMQSIIKNAVQDVLLKGNGYILINRGESGVITSLRYIPAGRVAVQFDEYNDTLYYILTVNIGKDSKKKSKIQPKDIIHLTKTTRDGIEGLSVMHFAHNSADLAKSSEDAAQQFFDSNMNVSGLLSCQTIMSEKQRQDIKNAWQQGRGKNALQILPANVNYIPLGTNSKDGQLLESRQYNGQVISQFFQVPEQLINSGAKLTYNSLEQLNLLFFQHTLLPYIVNIEQEFTRKIFTDEDDLAVDMDETEFLFRTSKQAEAQYLTSLVGNGIITVNEARSMIGLKSVNNGDSLHIAYSDASKAEIGNEGVKENE